MRTRHLSLMITLLTACPSPDHKTTPPKPGSGTDTVAKPPESSELGALGEGSKLHGFTTAAIYLDDADKPVGARFVHEATRFTLG